MDVKTPELDKQSDIINSGKAELIQEFYDWIRGRGWEIAAPDPDSLHGYYTPIYENPEQLMADFFGINRNKIESERRAILAALRETEA